MPRSLTGQETVDDPTPEQLEFIARAEQAAVVEGIDPFAVGDGVLADKMLDFTRTVFDEETLDRLVEGQRQRAGAARAAGEEVARNPGADDEGAVTTVSLSLSGGNLQDFLGKLAEGGTVTGADIAAALRAADESEVRSFPADGSGEATISVALDGAELEDFLDAFAPGAVVTNHGFTSATCGPPFRGNVRLIVDCESGRDISEMSHYPDEREILFPAGTDFRVIARARVADSGPGAADGHVVLYVVEA